MLKEAGAKEVHVRISSPPFLHPCYFGTDVPSNDQLIAAQHSTEEIRKMIGADSLGYMPVSYTHLPGIALDLPDLEYFPIRGPRMMAPISAATPPTI